jgi:hypothetical protein
MNKENLAKWNSFKSVGQVLTENRSTLEGNPLALDLADKFVQAVSKLSLLEDQTQQTTKATTIEKKQVRVEMIDIAYQIVPCIVNCAISTENLGLKSKFSYPKNKLIYATQVDLPEMIDEIIQACETHGTAMAEFMYTPEMLTQLKSRKAKFLELNNQGQIIVRRRRDANQQFLEQIRILDRLLHEKLDWVITLFKDSHPLFYKNYNLNRQLEHFPQYSYALQGKVVDKITGDSVQYGKAIIPELQRATQITSKGNFRFKRLPEGRYTLEVHNLSYKTTSLIFSHYPEQNQKMVIEMEPLPVEA